MPGGVQSRFMQVLGSDRNVALRRIALASILLALLAALAWYLLPPLGPAIHAGAAILGAFTGYAVAAWRARRFEGSIRDQWSQWMRFALSCDSVPEIHRRIQGGSTRNAAALAAGLLLLAWALETALLAMAIRDEPQLFWSLPALIANGFAAGWLLGHSIQRYRWTRGLQDSVTELVEEGEIGVWGVL